MKEILEYRYLHTILKIIHLLEVMQSYIQEN